MEEEGEEEGERNKCRKISERKGKLVDFILRVVIKMAIILKLQYQFLHLFLSLSFQLFQVIYKSGES